MNKILIGFILLVLMLPELQSQVVATGSVSGTVVDAKTGETLIGVIAVIDDNQALSASSDIDGHFTCSKIPAGSHKLLLRYVGYKVSQQSIMVKPGEVTSIQLAMEEESVQMKEVEVKAKTSRETVSALLVMQKNSTVIQSGVSSEDIRKSPDRNSADVIRRVSGATIQDGRYAIIRGLADRYNQAMVNNALLPSSEPDRKTFSFDMFPSNVLDNIIVIKTAQPDLQAEWAGGLIQLNTRDIPEKNFFNINYGISFNEGAVFQPYLTYRGSSTDFLGIDRNSRVMPSGIPSSLDLNFENSAEKKREYARLMSSDWGVQQRRAAYPGQSLQLSGGFMKKVKAHQLGGVFALSYGNSIRFSPVTQTRENVDGTPDLYYEDKRYTEQVNWALLANLSAILATNHKISFKNAYSQNSTDNTLSRTGVDYDIFKDTRRTNLEFQSSGILTSQLSGEHFFPGKDIKLKWQGGVSWISRSQPNTRRYAYERPYDADSLGGPNKSTDPFLMIFNNSFGSNPNYAGMFYSDLDEKIYSAGADLQIPFRLFGEKQYVKGGFYYQRKQREFAARQMYFTGSGFGILPERYTSLSPDVIFQPQYIDSFLTLSQLANPEDQYRAQSNQIAGYIMMENRVSSWFKAVWGFRAEYFNQGLTTPNNLVFDSVNTPEGPALRPRFVDTTYSKSFVAGVAQEGENGVSRPLFPLLPSINLIFSLNEKMNIRLSYAQTISRPEFREFAPFRYYDFIMESEIVGNPNLTQTLIHNVDARYEWFMGKGQTLNVSAFYKRFINPLEQTAFPGTGTQAFTFNNASLANNVGVELEFRKNLDFGWKYGENFTLFGNMAYIYSRLDLTNVKQNASDEQVRALQGQSPYVINLGLRFTEPKTGTGFNILYNTLGHRLYATGVVGNPAWYEIGRHVLDLQISQTFAKNGLIRFTISDLLAQDAVFYQNDVENITRTSFQPGSDFVVRREKNFRTFSLQISYSF